MRLGRTTRAAVAVAVSVGLLAVLISQVGLGRATNRLLEPALGFMGWAVTVYFVTIGIRAVRFWLLTQNARLTSVFAALAVQNFANKVTPFRLGELALPYLLGRTEDESTARAMVSLLRVRLLDLWVIVLAIGATTGLLFGVKGGSSVAFTGTLVGLTILAIAATITVVRFDALLLRLVRLARALLAGPRVDRPRISALLDKLDAAAAAGDAVSVGRHLALAGLTALAVGVNYLFYWLILGAYSVDATAVELVFGSSVGQVGALIPVAAVGTFGTLEAAWVGGFVSVGVSLDDAVVTGIATQLVSVVLSAALALPSYLWIVHRRR